MQRGSTSEFGEKRHRRMSSCNAIFVGYEHLFL
jgi:hypothetical protein